MTKLSKDEIRKIFVEDMVDFCQLSPIKATISYWVDMLSEYPEAVLVKSWGEILDGITPKYWPKPGIARDILNRNMGHYRSENWNDKKPPRTIEIGDKTEFHRWCSLMIEGTEKIKSGKWSKDEFYDQCEVLGAEIGIRFERPE